MKGIWESDRSALFVRWWISTLASGSPCSAAELAYFLILTFFPILLVCINGFIGILHLDSLTSWRRWRLGPRRPFRSVVWRVYRLYLHHQSQRHC